jgi:AcrR family transcriptional regulator
MPASRKPTASPMRPADAGAGGRAYGGLGPAERVAARRERFIEAGTELFGDAGFRGATVRGVCAAAGLTDRYFYESFPSLEALLAEVYRTLTGAFAQRLTQESIRSRPGAATRRPSRPRPRRPTSCGSTRCATRASRASCWSRCWA